MLSTLLDKRFLIVAGKGGVGKSTVCAALGLLAAQRGLKTCIAELNTREKAPFYFGKPAGGYQYNELRPNLFSINVQPDPALREYGLMKLRFENVYKLVFENEAMQRLLKIIPGMNELFLLGKVFNMEREKDAQGKPVWDLVIVDAPATGHGLSLLRLPDTILQLAKTGPMAKEVSAMRDLLRDPDRTAINLVTLPEEMPIRETIEFAGELQANLKMPLGGLFINGLWPALLAPEVAEILPDLQAALPGAEGEALSLLAAMNERAQFQEAYKEEILRALPWPKVEIPYLFRSDFVSEAIEEIASIVGRQLEGGAAHA